MTATSKTVPVRDLKPGDVLTSGATVLSNPYTSVSCPKGKTHIDIRYESGKTVMATWGKSTTVGVKSGNYGI